MSGWEERLHAFDDLGPDEHVYRRALEGPRRSQGTDGPSGPKRLVAGVVAVAVFAAAAVFAWQAFSPGDQREAGEPVEPFGSRAVITLKGMDQGPTVRLVYDGAEQEGVFERYSWCSAPDDCTDLTLDYPYPPIDDAVAIPAGTPIRFEGDGRVERFVVFLTERDRASADAIADSDGSSATIPDVPGDYTIWIAADWDRGSGAIYLRVQATASTDTDVVPDIQAIISVDMEALLELSWDAYVEQRPPRLDAWGELIHVDQLKADGLAEAMDALTELINERPDDTHLYWLPEVMQRRQYLCERLPADHRYRGGEYCD